MPCTVARRVAIIEAGLALQAVGCASAELNIRSIKALRTPRVLVLVSSRHWERRSSVIKSLIRLRYTPL